MSWFFSSAIQSPRVNTPSSSIAVPASSIVITFRSSSVYRSPVSGFFCSSTCASSLYVIAAAASTCFDTKRLMSNGWLTIVTSSLFFGSIPFFVSAAKSSNSLPQHHTPTFLPFMAATFSIPLSFHVTSVMPERAKTCAMLTMSPPLSRVARRDGSQSIPNSAPPLATTCSGVMSGPPALIVTSRPSSS